MYTALLYTSVLLNMADALRSMANCDTINKNSNEGLDMKTVRLWIIALPSKAWFEIKKLIYKLLEIWRKARYTKPLIIRVIKELLLNVLACGVATYFLYRLDLLILEKELVSIDEQAFFNVLLAGLSITGIILGLYCSNMVSIYSALYINAPRQIARLFEQDVVTNKSIKQIIGYIVFDLMLLVEYVLEIQFSIASLLILAVYTVYVIVYYSLTRNRSFQMSNTYSITQPLYNDIMMCLSRITKRGFLSGDPSFQKHYQKVCSKCLSELELIATFNLESPQNRNSSMLSFIQENIQLIKEYWRIKQAIPHDSKWFKEKLQHQQWHSISDSAVEIALNTGTSLAQTSVIDDNWFENKIVELNMPCLDKLCRDKDLSSIYSYLMQVMDAFGTAVIGNSVDFALQYAELLQRKIIPVCIEAAKDSTSAVTATAVVEMLVQLRISLIVSINNYLRKFNLDNILETARATKCYRKINFEQYSELNAPSVERMYHHIETEFQIEKKRITPAWYVDQTVSQVFYNRLCSMIRVLDRISNVTTPELGECLKGEKLYFPAMVVFSKMAEIKSKIELSCSLIDALLPELMEKHREENVVWDESPYETFNKNTNDTMLKLPEYWMTCAGAYALEHWENRADYPDLLGFCYNNYCEYLISAIETDNIDAFRIAYPKYLTVMFLYQEYIRKDLLNIKEQHRQPMVFHTWSAPFLECAMIAGLAIVWGEFSQNGAWRTIVDGTVAEFVEKNPEENNELLERWSQIVRTKSKSFLGIGNRGVLQTGWEMRITKSIWAHEMVEYEYLEYGQKILKTKSKLLHAYCGHSFEHMHLRNAEDVFFVECINKHLSADKQYKSQFGWERRLKDET